MTPDDLVMIDAVLEIGGKVEEFPYPVAYRTRMGFEGEFSVTDSRSIFQFIIPETSQLLDWESEQEDLLPLRRVGYEELGEL